jgi:hypothetical protein
MAIIKKKPKKQKVLVKMWRKGTLIHYWWECKLVQPLWKTVGRLLKQLNIELQYDLALHSWVCIPRK